MRRTLRTAHLLVLPTVLACLAMLELGLRLQGKLPSNVTDGIFEQHGSGYRLRRNMTKVSRTPSFECTIHTNDLGLRDRAPGPRALSAPYVAWVGDSTTFANGVDWEQSFVGVFEAKAAPRGVEVVNLAVGGHRFSDEEEMLYDFLEGAPAKPSVVAVVLTAQGITTFEQRYSDVFVKNGYLFPAKGWLLPYVTVTLGNTSSAYCFFRDNLRNAQARVFSAGAGGAAEVLELFSRESPWAGTEVPARFLARLERLDARIVAAGARPVYVYMPSSVDLRWKEFLRAAGRPAERYDFELYLGLLRRHCERHGIQLVNLLPLLQARHDAGERLSFAQDPHYNAAANALIGATLHDEILGVRAASFGSR
jgi:hypothetical protein